MPIILDENGPELAPTRVEPLARVELPTPFASVDAAPSSGSGRLISGEQRRYDTLDRLGQGGMGEVELCRDSRLGRTVARKLLHKDKRADAGYAARLLREALVQAQLEHPAIVPVYDLDQDVDGTLHFTMKRVRGTTLKVVLSLLRAGSEEGRPYSRHRLLTAFLSVCLAVDLAHQRGVVHRDLKPDNIMLGDFGEVYVLDWGIAKLVDVPDQGLEVRDTPELAAGATAQGAVLGTPGYMAPEQIRGEPVDARTDVYALGAILFELLTLDRLHAGRSSESLKSATLAGADPRPSARLYDVAPELDAICGKAAAPDPRDRFASARELHDAIQRFLEGDRDIELRRQLAEDHVAQALENADQAKRAGDVVKRSDAIRDLGRALALDPGNTSAADLLSRILTEPPATMPREASEAMTAARRAAQRVRARSGTVSYLHWLLYMPLWVWMGIRSASMLAVVSVAWVLAVIMSLLLTRRPASDGYVPYYVMVMTGVATACTSVVFGPFVFTPVAATAFAMALTLGTSRARRFAPGVMGVLAILVPAALEWTGVIPASYQFDAGRMCLAPRMVSFPAVATTIALAVANVVVVLLASFYGSSVRDALFRAEQRGYMQAWQLGQLIPSEALDRVSKRSVA